MRPRDDTLFFEGFEAALRGDADLLRPWLKQPSKGIQVYRNTTVHRAVDTLAATFPTVQLMTGPEWFRAAAREFAVTNPPSSPALLAYGEKFPNWLEVFPPALDTPYLTGISRLDWLWWESWSAADSLLLDAAELANITLERVHEVTLILHPALRLASFEVSIPSLWLAHQPPIWSEPHQLLDTPEAILFLRPGPHVQSRLVDEAMLAFLQSLQAGASILGAAQCALLANPECSLSHILTEGSALGLFTDISPVRDAIT